MPKSALFVIDIQNDLAGEGFPNTSPHAERIRKNGTEILKRARKAIEDAEKENHPPPLELVFVQHEEPEGPLVRGTDTWKLVFEPDGEKKTERLVSKKDGDTFESNPRLADELKSKGVEEIVVCGLQSECCVGATSDGALNAGLKVKLLSGAHSTYDDNGKTAAQIEKEVEEELRGKGAEIIAWEEWRP